MLSREAFLQGKHTTAKLYCSYFDGHYLVSGTPVSSNLFSKLFHLSDGYLTHFRFRLAPDFSIDGERVPETLFRLVQELVQDMTDKEAAVLKAEGRLHVPHPERPSALDELQGRFHPLPNGARTAQPSALHCLGHWNPTTPQRRVITRACANDPDARQELLSWFAPLEEWLVAGYGAAVDSREQIELVSKLAILRAVTSYPRGLFHHPNPRTPLHAWIDRHVEVCLRRILHLGPWRDRYVRERMKAIASPRTQGEVRLRQGKEESVPAREANWGDLSISRDHSPLATGHRPRTSCEGMPLDQILALANEGDKDAQAQILTSFVPLAKKLAHRYSDESLRQDLEQEAIIAVASAIQEYDAAKGTFAWLVERRMRDAIRAATKKARYESEGYSEECSDADHEEGAGGEVAGRVARLVSRWYEEDSNGSYGIWQGAGKDLKVALSEIVADDDRAILGRLFGLPGHERATQQELAAELGVSQQAISKRVKRVIKDLEAADWRRIHDRNVEEDPLDYW